MEIVRDFEGLPAHPYPVIALGNFDGVHMGHQTILRAAIDRARARTRHRLRPDLRSHPGQGARARPRPAPHSTSDDKLELLCKSGIDSVLVANFTQELSLLTPREFVRRYLVERIGVRTVVVGHSVSFGHNRAGNAAVMTELGREFGFDVVVIGPVNVAGMEVSSTKVREVIVSGDLRTAANLLGRPTSSAVRSSMAASVAARLGFPPPISRARTECLPPDGVYATRLILDDGPHASITNIGMRPTFACRPERTIEAHVFDFDRDIYDQEAVSKLIERIRPERHL